MLYHCRYKMFDIKLSVVLFLIWIFGVTSEDVFIMSENNCMTNSSLPIISNSPLKDIRNKNNDYLYVNDKMFNNFDDGNCGDYCSGSWNIKNSISMKNSEIIMDRRWEGDDKKLHFEPTNIDIPEKDLKIPMSIRGREIYIFFCTEQTVTSKCVWFILQGWPQIKSAIRKCNEDEIPTQLYKYPQNECEKLRNETLHTTATLFLFEDHWSHIFVQKQNNTWSIIHNDTTIISFGGSNSDPHYKNLILHAKTINALVKIHDYKFLSTTTEINEAWGPKITPEMSCLKIFVKMCYKCSLKISLQSNRETFFDREYKEPKWKEITINLPKRDLDGNFYFITKSDNAKSPFWAVDNISPCPQNDVRTISRHPEADCELVDGFGSQKIVQETYKNAEINTESSCTDDQLGFDICFPCTRSICGPKKYCQFKFPELKCACPPGSSVFNNECRRCTQSYYGIECRKTCPGCRNGCEYNGKCEFGVCNSYWRGDNCDIPTYPVFVNTPTVQDITPTTAKFIFNNFTLFGDGKESANSYIIELKEKSNSNWKDIDQNYIGVNYNKFYDGLKPDTTYLVRAIVDYTYNNPIDKYLEFNTTCKDTVLKPDYNVLSNQEDIEIQFKYEKCKQEGPLFASAIITCLSKWCQNKTFEEAIRNISDDQKFVIGRLVSYTDYDVQVHLSRFSDGRNAYLIRDNFTTLESVPNTIRDLSIYSIIQGRYTNQVSLRWLPPWPPQSKISHFKINYSYYTWPSTYRYSSKCMNSPCKIWKDYICCTIYNIYFDKIYTFQVTAVNYQDQESPSKELQHKIERQKTRTPYKVITEWNDENQLKLSWNHPNFTYGGPITHFIYQINGNSDIFYIKEEILTYTKDNIDVELEQEITILIKACNSECSYNTKKEDFSPPPKADIPNEIESTSFNYTINLTLPIINKICRKCQTIILLAIATEDNKTIDFDKNVIFEYDLDRKEKTFLIGDGSRLYSKYLNETLSNYPLKSGLYYNLSIRVINIYKNRESVKTVYYRVYTTGDPDAHLDKPKKFEKANSNMAYITLLILPIIAVGIFTYLKLKGKPVAVSEVENVPLNSFAQKRGEVLNLIPTSTQTKKSMPIALLDFEVYLKRSLENGSLEEQYENSIVYLFNPAQKKEKDRIMGYPATKIMCENLKYLLTESPTENNVTLFFKIVWQQHVSAIVGIVDDENEGKVLCPEINQSTTLENMTVTCISDENEPYVTLKKLKIAMKTKEKEVCYIQLSNWNQSATFLYLNVVSLLKILNTFNNSNNQSILIYSGSGYSPSDIIILSDICLKMALRDNHIDVLKYFSIIKEKYNRFLDNFQKYKIVYLMILESMFRINTNIPYDENCKEKMVQTISNNLEAQFKYLKDTEWIDELLGTENGSPIYTELLQFQTRTMADRSKYQIRNFVTITGLLNKNHLYAMQEPIENQNEGFWRFVVDSNTNVIVVLKRLEDKETNIFWPQKTDVITIDPKIAITFVNSVKFDSYELISLNIQMQQNNFPITLYVFAKWKTIDSVPMEYKDAVSFITESASTFNKSDAIIFTCWNGNTGCGLFVGLYFLIEAIKSTKSCDVCHTVRYIRNFNRQFIQNMKQFKFLYESSLESMLDHLLYDNLN